jgi:hypothetical protein
MKLRLERFRTRTMRSLVMLKPGGGAVKWSKLGDIVEIDDPIFAYQLLSICGDMLREVQPEKKSYKKAEPVEIESKAFPKEETKILQAEEYQVKGTDVA